LFPTLSVFEQNNLTLEWEISPYIGHSLLKAERAGVYNPEDKDFAHKMAKTTTN